MEKPVIGRLDLSAKDLYMIKGGASEINLGGLQGNILAKLTELQFNGLLDRLKGEAENAVVLNWEGGKIPRGAIINGKEVAWTQNGVVTSTDGDMIGTYDRLMENGGEKKNEQCLVVFPFKDSSTAR